MHRIKGELAVSGCEAYANTPHGKLRYDLLFHYYSQLLHNTGFRKYIDIGGGNGLLSERLLRIFPDLKVYFIDDDKQMIERATNKLKDFIDKGRVNISQGSVMNLRNMKDFFNLDSGNAVVGFNHVIEYIDDKEQALNNLSELVGQDSILGIMYLNNSHEALRRVLFKDSVDGVMEQIDKKKVNMGHFGWAEAMDSNWLDNQMKRSGMRLLNQFGLRCISDLKDPDFVNTNYSSFLNMECSLGPKADFMGLARYRLKFFTHISV